MFGNWIKIAALLAATLRNTEERIARLLSMPRA